MAMIASWMFKVFLRARFYDWLEKQGGWVSDSRERERGGEREREREREREKGAERERERKVERERERETETDRHTVLPFNINNYISQNFNDNSLCYFTNIIQKTVVLLTFKLSR